jgi:hypothetical protein
MIEIRRGEYGDDGSSVDPMYVGIRAHEAVIVPVGKAVTQRREKGGDGNARDNQAIR